MKIIKWETIKKNVANQVYTSMMMNLFNDSAFYALQESIHNKKKWNINLKDLSEKTYQIIVKWDIRESSKLLELFPFCLPKKYQNKPIICDMDKKDNWVLIIY